MAVSMNPLRFVVGLFRRNNRISMAVAAEYAAEQRFAEAVAIYRQLADLGNLDARHALAVSLEAGTGTLQNPGLAVRAYTQAAEQGHLPSIVRLGEIYLGGLARPDTTSAAVVAQLADPQAKSSVFHQLFPEGVSVEPDALQAARWNLEGAQADDPNCQARIGHQYAAGLGVARSPLLARKWFRRAAEAGSALGALGMGLLSLDHYGPVNRHYDPVPWLEKAIEAGDANAALVLGLYYLDHPEIERSTPAGQLLMKSSQAGHPFAMLKLGDCYAAGTHGLSLNRDTAELWLRRASAKGLTGANVRLLRLLADQPGRNDQELAVLAREAAEAGHAEAQYLMGVFCLTGQGTLKDPIEATKWLELAAEHGVMAAVERLGVIYASGLGQEPDYARALAAFDQAAAHGDLDARTHRAMLRQMGAGLPADPAMAAQEFKTAVDAGHAEAALQLGIAYASGLGVPQDWAQAAHYYSLAHERGVPEASFNLAHVTEQGLGVPADHERAIALFAAAADRGLVAAMWALYHRAAPTADGGLSDDQRLWLQRAAKAGDAEAAALLAPPVEPDGEASQTAET